MVSNETLETPMGEKAPATLCEAFQQTAARFPDRVALRTAGGAQEITWREYAERVRKITAGFAALGIGRGDTVALMLTNRPEAFVVDTAALHAGATPFSIYNTSSPEQIEYLLGHAEARVAVVEAQFAERVLDAKRSLPALQHVFVVDGEAAGTRPLSALENSGTADLDFESTWRAVGPDDAAVLIYTSGTTGAPKAVEITHANIIAARRMWESAIPELARVGRYMSYLPMAHLADRQVAHYPSMLTGSTVTTFTDAATAMASLREVRPTFSATVPRMWEKLKAALEAQFAQNAEIRAAVDAAMSKVRMELAGQPVPHELTEACDKADVAIFAKVREQLGYDDVDALMSGAAPIGEDVMVFFAALGLPILEVYGMSESATAGAANRKGGIRIGTVGPALPGMELELAEDGEILLRGAAVMRGYRNDPEKTAEAVDAHGWLHTGDIGLLDADGYLRIVDRKKDLIINSAGKNMSPVNIENKIKSASSLIGYAVAIGDRRSYNTALIVLDPEGAAGYAKAHGLSDASPAYLATEHGVQAEIAAAVETANGQLSRVEQIKKFTVLPVEWQPDGDELTPTMKIKRKPIADKYAAEIDAMYAG
jgi:long-subunit acyl-CoA synthetase (AMP-forming)